MLKFAVFVNHRFNLLNDCLNSLSQADYPKHSRVHSLRTFNFPSAKCYVKREDELGFAVSGSKIRKYRSLIPYLLNANIQEVVVIGTAYSNHVLSVVQLLIEVGIRPTLFLRGNQERYSKSFSSEDHSLQGNLLFTSTFVPSSSIHWFSPSEWKDVESKGSLYASQQNYLTYVLPEGGGCSACLPGALSLPLDLLKNESDLDLQFDHIFIEAGTGFMASALLLALHWLEHRAHVHILLLAEDKQAFQKRFKEYYVMFQRLLGIDFSFPSNFSLYLPLLTKGFGEIHNALFNNIHFLAQNEGFLTDPIYSTKLFIESRRLIEQEKLRGNILILHSGGALTLAGFQRQLQIN